MTVVSLIVNNKKGKKKENDMLKTTVRTPKVAAMKFAAEEAKRRCRAA